MGAMNIASPEERAMFSQAEGKRGQSPYHSASLGIAQSDLKPVILCILFFSIMCHSSWPDSFKGTSIWRVKVKQQEVVSYSVASPVPHRWSAALSIQSQQGVRLLLL